MRVISGTARGCKLQSLDGLNTRPTIDRIKETLFNIININIQDSNFLDLCGGSGAIAIEALSRGANKATIVEKNNDAINIINKNLQHTKLNHLATVYEVDSIKFLEKNDFDTKYDIVFIDPPYELKLYTSLIELIIKKNILNQEGIIIVERSSKDDAYNFDNLEIYKQKKFKTTTLDFLRYR